MKQTQSNSNKPAKKSAMAAIASGVASGLSEQRIMGQQDKAEASKASAGFSATGFGKAMASDYLESLTKPAGTFARDILILVKQHKDTDRAEALKAASDYAKEYKEQDETAALNLLKRITEARRVFKHALVDYSATVAILENKGTWAAKVKQFPKSAAGRKAGMTVTGNGEASKEAQAQADAMKAAESGKTTRHVSMKAEIIGAIETLSPADMLDVIDRLLFKLSVDGNEAQKSFAKVAMKHKDELDNAGIAQAATL